MSTRDKWFELIDKLGVFSQDGQRAVHKPLLTLMILARAQEGRENKFYFVDLEPELRDLLTWFSNSKVPKCNYPFWYLQNDGYWIVRSDLGDPQTRKGKSNEPTEKGLREAGAFGSVPADLWDALIRDRTLAAGLATKLMDDFWSSSIREDLVSAIGLDVSPLIAIGNRRDREFRDVVLRAYNFRCAICGFDGCLSSKVFGVEAAHIQSRSPKLGNGPDSLQNGMSLCSLHHKALDYGAISFTDDLRILVSTRLSGDQAVSHILRHFANTNLTYKPYQESDWPDAQFTRWHRANLFRAPPLETA